MINRINEKIYSYIFSVNAELKNDKSLDIKPFLDKLDKIIAEKYDVIADFWDENVNDFNKDCVIKTQTLDTANATYIYRDFPRMNSRTLITFLEHKASQIKNTIEDNGDFIKETLNYVFDEIENLGIKQILDYCEEIGIVKYIGKVFIAADDNPVKIIDVKITEGYKLILKFNNILNDLWIDTLLHIDREELFGYGPEKFDFYRDTATINLNPGNIDSAPKIVDYFKQWIVSTNKIYPQKLKDHQKREEIIRQQKIKKEMQDNEQLREILKNIKI